MNQIQGIDKVIFSSLPDMGTILVQGDTGVLKSTFVAESIKTNLKSNPENVCLFVSLKDNKSFFLSKPGLKELIDQERLIVIDYEEILDSMPPTLKKRNIFEGITDVAFKYKEKFGSKFSLFAIDPINLLEDTIKADNLRRVLFHFFSQLNDLGTTNWIVMESYTGTILPRAILPYHFLADGIINLGMIETLDDVIRYMEIRKMRGVNHSLKKYQVSYKNHTMKVLSAIHES